MDKQRLLTCVAVGITALSGCAATPVTSPPPLPPQSVPQAEVAAAIPSPAGPSNETGDLPASAVPTIPEVTVYGRGPERAVAPKVPCGLASLAWSLTNVTDAWRIVFPVLPSDDIEACARAMGGELPAPLHRQEQK